MSFLKTARAVSLALSVAATGLAVTAVTDAAWANKPAVFVDTFQPAAAGGYDVTSFFTGHPVAGSAQFTATDHGAQYRFASAANRDKFLANPAAYTPQYGGYCAWAVAQGRTAPGRPQFWRVVDNKLYFNFNADIQTRWVRDIPGNIAVGNRNWPTVLTK